MDPVVRRSRRKKKSARSEDGDDSWNSNIMLAASEYCKQNSLRLHVHISISEFVVSLFC